VPQFEGLVPTTELDAVNTLLSTVGEASITDLDVAAPLVEDVAKAVDILKLVMRRILTRGWKFNTEFQFRIPTSQVGTTPVEDGFTVPADMLAFEVTHRADQFGPRSQKAADGTLPQTNLLDITIDREPQTDTLRFYDRLRNTRVFDPLLRPQIFITLIKTVDFEYMPESARQFIALVAAREFAQSVQGDATQVSFTNDDVRESWRVLRKNESVARPRNALANRTAFEIVGNRYRNRIII